MVRRVQSSEAQLTESQRLLLLACSADDSGLQDALEAAGPALGPGADSSCVGLYPLVYRRMRAADLDHPQRDRMRQHYLATWRDNRRLLDRALPVLGELERLNSPAVLLKGAAMVSSEYFAELGVRRMADIDLLIDPASLVGFLDWAEANGWRGPQSAKLTPREQAIAHHSIDLCCDGGGAIDVHANLLVSDRNPVADAELIRTSLSAEVAGVAVEVLHPTGMLFHALAHYRPTGIRHLADAMFLCDRKRETLDWSWLCNSAVERRTTAVVADSLEQVVDLAPHLVPSWVMPELRGIKPHWADWNHQSVNGLRASSSRVWQRTRGMKLRERIRVSRLMAKNSAGFHGSPSVAHRVLRVALQRSTPRSEK